MNILITGSNGYIGSSLVNLLSNKYHLSYINRNIFDLRDSEKTQNWFTDKYFDIVIHTAIKGGSRLQNDSNSIIEDNIKLYTNLIRCKNHFNKLINIGSGAEKYAQDTPYGYSKKIINDAIQTENNCYNIRIYGIFDSNELETRFIKNNIRRYIKKEQLLIHKNKYMDFIYMLDFIKIIEFYIHNTNPPKNIDCVYNNKYSLLDIAKYINNLDNNKTDIIIEDSIEDKNYTGDFYDIGIQYIGLQQGIKNTYRELKNEKNMVCTQ